MHDGDYLDCINFVGDFFNAKIRIWWHCDDANTTEIMYLSEEVYTRESRKLITKKGKLFQALKTYCLWFISEQKN